MDHDEISEEDDEFGDFAEPQVQAQPLTKEQKDAIKQCMGGITIKAPPWLMGYEDEYISQIIQRHQRAESQGAAV